MTDTKRKYYSQLIELMRKADVAVEVVDARFINETRIEKLEGRFGNKIIIAACKSDLIPKERREPGYIYFSTRTRDGIKEILQKAVEVGKKNPFRRTKEVKMVIFGIPNVGKSSLINALRKKYSAVTGFRAGLTHGPQWIRVSPELMLCDTAGVVDLHETEESMAMKSALDVTELKRPEQISAKLISKAGALPRNPIFKYYGIEKAEDAEDTLIQIAKKRGLLGKGGEPNIHEAAKMLLRDYQKGKFIL
jgi:ribosome biogenesis GTPase A